MLFEFNAASCWVQYTSRCGLAQCTLTRVCVDTADVHRMIIQCIVMCQCEHAYSLRTERQGQTDGQKDWFIVPQTVEIYTHKSERKVHNSSINASKLNVILNIVL